MSDERTTSSALIPQPSSLSKPLNGHWDPLGKVHRRQSDVAHLFLEQIAGEAEPVPGIPPTAKHLGELVALIKARKIPILLQEPYFSDDAGKFLARETGLRVVVASQSCDASTAGSYLTHFQDVMGALAGSSTPQ